MKNFSCYACIGAALGSLVKIEPIAPEKEKEYRLELIERGIQTSFCALGAVIYPESFDNTGIGEFLSVLLAVRLGFSLTSPGVKILNSEKM